jgi:hypothetical protein
MTIDMQKSKSGTESDNGNASPPAPALSVVVLVGSDRIRANRLLEVLALQTLCPAMEVVLVDIAGKDAEPLHWPTQLPVRLLSRAGDIQWGNCRAEGVWASRAPIVAFLEDHTVPSLGWAEAVQAGLATNGVAGAYAFTNGSPDTYWYRSVFMAEYGMLAHPLRPDTPPTMAANNLAYRRDVLLAVGENLGKLLELDFFLQKALPPEFAIKAIPGAVVAHQTNSQFRDLVRGHFGYARLFASRRLLYESWNIPKRLLAALAVPLLVPLLRLWRAYSALSGHPAAPEFIRGLPVILLLYFCGALGESWGLIWGTQMTCRNLIWLEQEAPRARRE